ncbi:MAG: fibrobacter succinogenes major paralogous domain-containing protein [Flavobacterium sp.]
MKKVSLIFILLIGFGCISYAQTITIGTQVWMTKNLDVATFRNGDPIPQAKTNEEWIKAGENQQPAWCYYDNDPANGAKYGKLYNWYAVNDSRGLAPVGYHIPSDAEWTKLTDFLGGESVAGTKMKSKSGWNSYTTGGSKTCPNCVNWNAKYRRKVPCHTCQDTRSVPAPKVTNSGNGTNTSGFSGLPGGLRNLPGTFDYVGEYGFWWSSTEYSTYAARGRFLFLLYDDGNVGRDELNKELGFSVRCLRD